MSRRVTCRALVSKGLFVPNPRVLDSVSDGLDLRLEQRGQVLVRGRRVPIVGAVSMDMITVDVTGVDAVQPGDEVVLIGRQGAEAWQQIDVREMAAAIGTVPYEIVYRIGARIERQYSP